MGGGGHFCQKMLPLELLTFLSVVSEETLTVRDKSCLSPLQLLSL